ncbi:unnamed protein product [Tilletia caries]|nr:hypothetical protein CF336_g8157 [Tilletia laevis]CAD6897578.1 unnamed protein product [Tilletia caries]
MSVMQRVRVPAAAAATAAVRTASTSALRSGRRSAAAGLSSPATPTPARQGAIPTSSPSSASASVSSSASASATQAQPDHVPRRQETAAARKNDFFTPHQHQLPHAHAHAHDAPPRARQSSYAEDDEKERGNTPSSSSDGGGGGGLSEHEYEVRIGRAIDLLRSTLPDFMRLGLVDSPPSSSSSAHSIPLLDPLSLVRIAAPTLRRRRQEQRRAGVEGAGEREGVGGGGSIYHPDVLFEFMPSLTSSSADDDGGSFLSSPSSSSSASSSSSSSSSASPSSPASSSTPEDPSSALQDEIEGKASFSFSGRTLYLASAHVLRHALNAIFSEPHVSVDRLRLVRAGKSGSGGVGGGGRSGIHSHSSHRRIGDEEPPEDQHQPLSSRSTGGGGGADELIARLTFSGLTRVTQQPHEYTVLFRYTLDRGTGQIGRHRVERIQPEVGRSVSFPFPLLLILLSMLF